MWMTPGTSYNNLMLPGVPYTEVGRKPYAGIIQPGFTAPPSGLRAVAAGQLINGASGLFQQAPHTDGCQVNITLPLNSWFPGARYLLAGLLLDGSQATKTLLNQLSAQGIAVSAGPLGDQFGLSVSGPSGSEAQVMQAAMTLLTQSVVDPIRFNALKRDALKDLEKMASDPELPLNESMNKGFYGKTHPYARGSKALTWEIEGLTLEKVMSVFRQALATPQQSQVMMISPLPAAEQHAMVSGHVQQFGWYAHPCLRSALPTVPPVPRLRGVQGPLYIPSETLTRARVTQMFRAPAVDDPDYPAFQLLFQMLQGMSGHFFKVLRTEKGLVYNTQQAYTRQANGGSNYRVHVEVDFDKIIPALQGIQQVIDGIRRTPPKESELAMVKRQYILNLRDAMQTASGISEIAQPWLRLGKVPPSPEALRMAIERVKPEDVMRVAERVFNPKWGCQLVGISAPQHVLNKL